jgi:hypothetical protein
MILGRYVEAVNVVFSQDPFQFSTYAFCVTCGSDANFPRAGAPQAPSVLETIHPTTQRIRARVATTGRADAG